MLETKFPEKEYPTDYQPWVAELSPFSHDDAFDALDEAAAAAPKFSIHTVREGSYIAIIDRLYIKKFDSKFNPETINRITGVEAPQLLDDVVLYFRSSFPIAMIRDAIKFSFL